MTVFHGSNVDFDKVSLDFAKDRRDFGIGFYTTTIREQAKAWARDLCIRHKTENLNGRYDVEYTLKQLSFFRPNDQLSVHSEKALCNLSLVEKRSWKL
jgi:hypothetical protein